MPSEPAGPGSRGGNWVLDTVEDVREYVAHHAQSYGGMHISGDHVVVSFTEDLDQHLRDLRAVVEHPDLVRVESAAYPLAKLEADIREINDRLGRDPRRPLLSCRPGHLGLRAPFAGLAAQLHEECGDALDITVGSKPYPPERIGDRASVPIPTSTVEVPGLDLSIAVDTERVSSGLDVNERVIFSNRGSNRIAGMTGMLTGGIRAEGDDRMAGGFYGAIPAIGRQVELDPGASMDLPIIIGTTSCLPDSSYVVPPGRYEVVAAIPFHLPHAPPRPQPLLVVRDAWIVVEESADMADADSP